MIRNLAVGNGEWGMGSGEESTPTPYSLLPASTEQIIPVISNAIARTLSGG